MRILADIFGQILRTLLMHKLRSLLTMFGIAWGVGSLLLLVGLGEGFRSGNKRNMSEYGQNIIWLYPGRVPALAGSLYAGRHYRLTYEDYQDVRGKAPDVLAITPVLSRTDVRAVSDFASANGEILGVEPQYNGIRYLPLKQGRWLNGLDESQRRNVIVLGDEMTRNLFPGRPVIGAGVRLDGMSFEVIGTIARVGRGDNNSTNMRGYIPYQVMSVFFPLTGENERHALSFLNFQPRTAAVHRIAVEEVKKVIAQNHGFNYRDQDAFDVDDSVQAAEAIGTIFDVMDMFLGAVGAVTLALGAIGVINIMLVSVSERTREIGLRKALGATNRNILWQFFLEGILLTFLSGILGLVMAGGVMLAFGSVQGPQGFDPPRLVPMTATLAISCLTIAAVGAGLYPARKAAMLQPVDALRQE
jgi:putative ABC transport system permease protein